MTRRHLALILVLTLSLGLFSFASADENTFTLAGYDSNTSRTWETNAYFTRSEKETGIHFLFEQYTDSQEWKKAKEQMTADSSLPDALFMAELTGAESIDLINKGVLVDLAPLLEECCPNLCALMEKYPEIREAVTLPDGTVAALPYINETPMNCGIWINKKWLSACRLELPTDLASFEEMLIAFRDTDPNRNGKNDEIPLAFLGTFDLKFLAHAWGLISNDYNLFTDENGQVRFMPLEDGYRDFVLWCRDAFRNGLLDKNGFSTADTLRTVSDSSSTQTYGAVITTTIATFLPQEWTADYVMLPPLCYDGSAVYRDFFGHVTAGTFAVTAACSDVKALLTWADRLYTYEGSILASAGLENTDYTMQGDGRWQLINESNASGIQAADLLTGGSPYPGYSNDVFQAMYYKSTVFDLLEEYRVLNGTATRPFPYYMLTKDQEAFITPLQNAIAREVDMQTARWITGEDSFDDTAFAAFGEKLGQLGLQEFIAFWSDVVK